MTANRQPPSDTPIQDALEEIGLLAIAITNIGQKLEMTAASIRQHSAQIQRLRDRLHALLTKPAP